jgi:hypothetical protein
MKTKRLLALLLAVLMMFGSGAAFNVSAANGVDDVIAVHISNIAPNGDFAQSGYFFAWVTGVYPGNIVTWTITDAAGSPLSSSINPGSANAAGYTCGLGLPAGKYKISVTVTQGPTGTEINTNTPNSVEFVVPDRKLLRDALNSDKTIGLHILYDDAKWKVYDKAKKNAIAAYGRYDLGQEKLDEIANAYSAAINDLPLKGTALSEFLWHLLNLFYTLFGAIPFGDKPYYTL